MFLLKDFLKDQVVSARRAWYSLDMYCHYKSQG